METLYSVIGKVFTSQTHGILYITSKFCRNFIYTYKILQPALQFSRNYSVTRRSITEENVISVGIL